MSLMDKGNKQIYFSDEIEYTIEGALNFMKGQPMNTEFNINTDDKGYFRRAFDERFENPFWKDIDVFLEIGFTMGVTSILWIITSIMDLCKFLRVQWYFACHVLLYIILDTLYVSISLNYFLFNEYSDILPNLYLLV